MELIYITHNNLLNLQVLPPVVSLAIAIGGFYGSCRLVYDAIRMFRPRRSPTSS